MHVHMTIFHFKTALDFIGINIQGHVESIVLRDMLYNAHFGKYRKSSVNLHTVWIMHTTLLLVRVAFMYLQTFTLHIPVISTDTHSCSPPHQRCCTPDSCHGNGAVR